MFYSERMDWFYLALLAPFLFAIVNLIDDNLLSFVYESPVLATMFAGLFGGLPILSRLFIHADPVPLHYILIGETAGLLTVMFYYFYFRGLESDFPSTVIAMFGLATGILPIFAHFLLGERLLGLQILGFLIVLFASLGLAVKNLRSLHFSKALIPVLLGVVFMVISTLLTKDLYDHVDFYGGYLYFSLGMGLGGFGFLMLDSGNNLLGVFHMRRKMKKLWVILVFAELLNLAAMLIFNIAISRGPISLVKVIENIQPLFVLLIALALYPFSPRYFREAEEGGVKRKIILMTVAIVGLAIIALAV